MRHFTHAEAVLHISYVCIMTTLVIVTCHCINYLYCHCVVQLDNFAALMYLNYELFLSAVNLHCPDVVIMMVMLMLMMMMMIAGQALHCVYLPLISMVTLA